MVSSTAGTMIRITGHCPRVRLALDCNMDTEVERIVREFQKQRQHLLCYIRALTCDADRAEDFIQEISVIVLRMANAGERPDNLPAWCRGIARNLLLHEQRDRRRLVYIDS